MGGPPQNHGFPFGFPSSQPEKGTLQIQNGRAGTYGCGCQNQWDPIWGQVNSHLRTYFSARWDVHCGYDLDFDPWPYTHIYIYTICTNIFCISHARARDLHGYGTEGAVLHLRAIAAFHRADEPRSAAGKLEVSKFLRCPTAPLVMFFG